jgi:hypothetical protein
MCARSTRFFSPSDIIEAIRIDLGAGSFVQFGNVYIVMGLADDTSPLDRNKVFQIYSHGTEPIAVPSFKGNGSERLKNIADSTAIVDIVESIFSIQMLGRVQRSPFSQSESLKTKSANRDEQLNCHSDSELKLAMFQLDDEDRAKTTQQKHKLKRPEAKTVNPTPNQSFKKEQLDRKNRPRRGEVKCSRDFNPTFG